MVSGDYARAWNDCLTLVMEILEHAKGIKDATRKIEYVKALVEERQFILTFDEIKTELGIFKELF